MASALGLRQFARGGAPRLFAAASRYRCFAAAASSGGHRPGAPPVSPTPPPRPPAVAAAPPAPPAKPPAASAPSAAPPATPQSEVAASPAVVRRRVRARGGRRDPERPKRPATPWLRFLSQFRSQNTALKGPEVMRAAAGQWKALSGPQRKPYEAPYEAEKKLFDKAFAEYVASGKRDAWKRDPEKPKRPPSGFLRLAGEYRAKNPTLKITEVTKKAGAVWKSMSSAAKAPYEKQYATEKVEYEKLMQAYKESGKEEAWKAKTGLTAAEKQKAREAAQKEKVKAAAKTRKAREAAGKLTMKATAARQKARAAAKKLKMKAAALKLKAKEAAKKLKVMEAAAKTAARQAEKKLKAIKAAATKEKAKAKPATASKKEMDAAPKLALVQHAKKTESEPRAAV